MNKFLCLSIFVPGLIFGGRREKIVDLCEYTDKEDHTPLPRYITGDAFREISDFTFENKYIYNYHKPTPSRFFEMQGNEIIENLIPGDIVFVQTLLLDLFFLKVHPKIKHPYILITHNSHCIIDEVYLPYLKDPKIIKWFAQDIDVEHEKIVHIPLGVLQKFWIDQWYKKGEYKCYDECINYKIERKNKVYININAGTFPEERGFVLRYFKDKNFIYTEPSLLPLPDYLKNLHRYRFTLAPSGSAIDTFRTWESMLMGCIPIVRPFRIHTKLIPKGFSRIFEDLPAIVVKDWHEVTPEFLDRKYREIKSKTWNLGKLYFPYWHHLILQAKIDFQEKYAQFFSSEEYLESFIEEDRAL